MRATKLETKLKTKTTKTAGAGWLCVTPHPQAAALGGWGVGVGVELEAELAQHGPPPPQHVVASQFASAEASEVTPQEASWSETLQPHVVAPALEQRTQFSPSSGSSSFAPHATTAALREGDSEIAPPPLTFLPPQPLPRRPTIFEGVEYDC